MKVSEAKTAGQVFDLALACNTEQEAESLIRELSDDVFANHNEHHRTRGEVETIMRENLAYFAGYYDNEVRAKIERLFKAAHPIFGAIAKNGPPTPEQAFSAGLKAGQAMKEAQDRKGY